MKVISMNMTKALSDQKAHFDAEWDHREWTQQQEAGAPMDVKEPAAEQLLPDNAAALGGTPTPKTPPGGASRGVPGCPEGPFELFGVLKGGHSIATKSCKSEVFDLVRCCCN